MDSSRRLRWPNTCGALSVATAASAAAPPGCPTHPLTSPAELALEVLILAKEEACILPSSPDRVAEGSRAVLRGCSGVAVAGATAPLAARNETGSETTGSGPVTVFQRSGERCSSKARQGDVVAAHMLNALEARYAASRPAAPCSTEAYDRLLAGETVSWLQILREHRMLGSVTVPQLIAAGAVHMIPLGDTKTQVIDVRLRLRDRRRGQRDHPSLARAAQDRASSPVTGRARSRHDDARPSRPR